jgi:hypothetical protein
MFLQKVEESPTVRNLTTNQFPALIKSVPYRVGDILDRPNIAMLKKVVDTPLLEMFIAVLLTDMIDTVNIDQRLNIQGHQVPVIAGQLVDQYPTESLEDFVLCFKRGSTGFYGTIYNLDASVLNNWMRTYLEEKYSLVEAEHAKAKQEDQQAATIDYRAYIERREKERQQAVENPKVPDNWKTNELERFKLQYKETSREVIQRKIHRTSSEFYAGQSTADLKVWTDENTGYDIYARTEEDAEKIYNMATEKQ